MRTIQLIQLYFRICEVYDNQLILHCWRHTKNGQQPKFTDPEVLCCYLFATAWQRCDGPKACYDYMKNHYQDWFPDLPSHQAFNHRLNRLAEVLPLYVQACCEQLFDHPTAAQPTSSMLTDSFPVVTCSAKRRDSNCTVLANKGRCATKSWWFRGVKVHLGAWEQAGTLPLPDYLIISPASVHDKRAQEDLLRQVRGVRMVGDQAYVDCELGAAMNEQGSELITPPRYGRGTEKEYKQRHGAAHRLERKLIGKFRQPIETLFSWLCNRVDIERASRVRSYRGLLVHIYGRIAAALSYRSIVQLSS